MVAAGGDQPAARVAVQDGMPVVQVEDDFDRAWRRVGLALDRTGFTVEDRDRSQGIYFVRYLPPDPNKKEQGFFGKLFGRPTKPAEALKYQVRVKSSGNQSVVTVLKGDGTPETSDNARRIAQLLADDLK
jgi:outer membrane protein assembly factor BamC